MKKLFVAMLFAMLLIPWASTSPPSSFVDNSIGSPGKVAAVYILPWSTLLNTEVNLAADPINLAIMPTAPKTLSKTYAVNANTASTQTFANPTAMRVRGFDPLKFTAAVETAARPPGATSYNSFLGLSANIAATDYGMGVTAASAHLADASYSSFLSGRSTDADYRTEDVAASAHLA